MAETVKDINKNVNHIVTIENKKKIMLTGIIEVLSATDKTVVTKTRENTIHIIGESLRVSKLSLEEGVLIIEGLISNFKYLESIAGKGIIKRIFK